MNVAGVTLSSDRYWAIAATKASSDGTPFFTPKASHAVMIGRIELLAKTPKPPTTFRGLFSRNAKRSPSLSAPKLEELGFQKLTSSTPSMPDRKSNQRLSVLPM
jgi:hypothetical protein